MSNYIKSPMNYIGGKFKLLKYIIPNFPEKINNFVDLFAGGLNVGINVEAKTIYVNEHISYLIDLYKIFKQTSIETLISDIEERIACFNLSKINNEGYNALRNEYNKTKSTLDLFVLLCYSFNNQIRFNKQHKFNMPFGKNRSSFNQSMKKNLISFCQTLKTKNIIFSNKDFMDFNFNVLKAGDVVYCDPPYLITTAPYNDGNGGFKNWTQSEDLMLFDLLDRLNQNGIFFFLSNVFVHKNKENKMLIQWSEKYNVMHIDNSYSNCNYHSKDKTSKTDEVLISNCKLNQNLSIF